MTIPNDRVLTIPVLRQTLGLPPERPDGVRELLAVPRDLGEPIPNRDTWRLALGDWPEIWHAEPGTGPSYLVMLRGPASPYFIATIEDIEPDLWGSDTDAPPEQRVIPVRGTAYEATAVLAGAQLEMDLTFGWDRREEQYAFL
jgi:hypothetical protein